MEARKAEWLEKIFGKEMADGVIASAESKSKELEESGTRYKENKETGNEAGASLVNFETIIKALPEGEVRTKLEADYVVISKALTPTEEKKEVVTEKKEEGDGDPPPASETFGLDQITNLANLLAEISTQVSELSTIKETVAALEVEIKELKKSDDEKVANTIAPRWQPPLNARPSEDGNNVILDADLISKLNKEFGTLPDNPVKSYVDDLIGVRGS